MRAPCRTTFRSAFRSAFTQAPPGAPAIPPGEGDRGGPAMPTSLRNNGFGT
jgi:hypothetical protein